jgi:hypothetical protein
MAPKVEKGFRLACEDLQPERLFVVYPGSESFSLRDEVEAIGSGALARVLSTA